MRKKRTSWIETDNIYLFLLYKIIIALFAVILAQAFFHFCANRMYDIHGFGVWMGILWGNIVYGLAAVGTVLLPYLIMMLVPSDIRWKKPYRIVSECFYILGIFFLIFVGCCDAAYFQHTYRLISSDIFTYMTIGGQFDSLIPLFIRD